MSKKKKKVNGKTAESQPQTAQEPQDETKQSATGGFFKRKLSGNYYVATLPDKRFYLFRGMRTVCLLLSALLFSISLTISQDVLEYITVNARSWSYTYLWTVFIVIVVYVYCIALSFWRAKLEKRIIVERAPKRGFKNHTFLCFEILLGVSAAMFVFQLALTIAVYSNASLGATFLCFGAFAAAVASRQFSLLAMKDAQLVICEKADETPSESGVTAESDGSASDIAENNAQSNKPVDTDDKFDD